MISNSSKILAVSFFRYSAVETAPRLLGNLIVRSIGEKRISGMITECEAYQGEEDLACHARAGRTKRTEVMYGEAGRAYIYFTYGMHWMLNCVTDSPGIPAAVLLRAVLPLEGVDFIAEKRQPRPRREWCNGPAKICQALAIDGSFNGIDLCNPSNDLRLEQGQNIPDEYIIHSPRVGIPNVAEPWRSIPWRFQIAPDYLTKFPSEKLRIGRVI